MFFKKKIKLFYDISELGWSMYLAAHIRYLFEHNVKAAVVTPKAKEVLYRGVAHEILPMPQQYKVKYHTLPSDGNHLFDPETNTRLKDHLELSKPFREAYPGYKIVTKYSTFADQRVFKPYQHTKESEEFCKKNFGDNLVIIIFPRHRESKFKCRNVDKEYWIEIATKLCSSFTDCIIVSIGSKNGAYDIMIDHTNYYNLVRYDDNKTLDILVALCNSNMALATVGTQSGPIKISLLCKTPSFIYGHEETRHLITENWSKTDAGFWMLGESEDKYIVSDFDEMYQKTFNFITKQYNKRKK